MRSAFLVLVVLVPALAAAKPRLTTSITAHVDEDEAMTTAVTDALHDKQRKLDTCWRKAATTKARIVFEHGKVTTVELTEKGDPKAAACVARALRTTRLASTLRVIATIELESRDPRKIESVIDRNLSTGLSRFTTIGGPHINNIGITGFGAGTGTGTKLPARPAGGGNSLSTDQINRVIKANASGIRRCYQSELSHDPDLEGKVVVRFVIAADGSVRTAAIAQATLRSELVQNCIVQRVIRFKFPASAGTSHVTYPFLFSRG